MIDRALIVAVGDRATADRLPGLAPGWEPVPVDPATPDGELVAVVAEACGGWPERSIAVADGGAGGRFVLAALSGLLPVDGVAADPVFDRSPLAPRRPVPLVVVATDPDVAAVVDRLEAAGHPVERAADLGNALSRLVARPL